MYKIDYKAGYYSYCDINDTKFTLVSKTTIDCKTSKAFPQWLTSESVSNS